MIIVRMTIGWMIMGPNDSGKDGDDVDHGGDDDGATVGKVVPDRQAAESGVSQVKVGVHLQLGHLESLW